MKITLYTVTDCQFSKQEKEYLTSRGLPYIEKNLETNREYLTEMLAASNNFAGTPVTKIEKDNGQAVVLKGFTKEEFDRELPEASAMAMPVMNAPVVSASAPAAQDPWVAPTDTNPPTPTPTIPEPPVTPPAMPEPTPSSPPVQAPEAPVMPPMQEPTQPEQPVSTMSSTTMPEPTQPQQPQTPTEPPTMPQQPEPASPPPSAPTPSQVAEPPVNASQNVPGLNSILDQLQSKSDNTAGNLSSDSTSHPQAYN